MSLASICSNGVWSLYISGHGSYTVNTDHPNYLKLLEAIKAKDEELIIQLVDIPKSVAQFSSGKVSIRDGQVFYDNVVLHNNVVERILALMSEGFSVEPLVKFVENLMDNPSYHSIKHLWNFLEQRGIPITDDGCFLAYKAVRGDWMDKYSGTIRNMPGDKPSVPRNQVDDNHQHHCSNGLHAGIMEYVVGYGSQYNGDKFVLVKINPKDCVSVPEDANFQKLRVCEYEVLEEIQPGQIKTSALYKSDGTAHAVVPKDEVVGSYAWDNDNWNDDDDDDWDTYEEDDWNDDDDDWGL